MFFAEAHDRTRYLQKVATLTVLLVCFTLAVEADTEVRASEFN
jgi:hypothetical protein